MEQREKMQRVDARQSKQDEADVGTSADAVIEVLAVDVREDEYR